jgi:hypothetical protein
MGAAVTPCPTPTKIKFPNKLDAVWQLKHLKANSHENKKRLNRMHVYRCRCGAFHLGHDGRRKPAAFRRRKQDGHA